MKSRSTTIKKPYRRWAWLLLLTIITALVVAILIFKPSRTPIFRHAAIVVMDSNGDVATQAGLNFSPDTPKGLGLSLKLNSVEYEDINSGLSCKYSWAYKGTMRGFDYYKIMIQYEGAPAFDRVIKLGPAQQILMKKSGLIIAIEPESNVYD